MPEMLRGTLVGSDASRDRFREEHGRGQAPGEATENELDKLIERRVQESNGETLAQKQEREYRTLHEQTSADIRAKHRVMWRRYHLAQAERLQNFLEIQVQHHLQQAERYA